MKPKPPPKPPTSNEEVLTALQQYFDTHSAWPTLDELVQANPGWDGKVTENRLFALRNNPTGEALAPVVRSPGTEVYRLSGYTEPAPKPEPKRVEYPPEPEILLMEVPEVMDKPKPKSRPNWPSDANLIRLYRTIKARGGPASHIIGRRYDCTPSAVVQRLAGINKKIGSGAMPNPEGFVYCEDCFDTGWMEGREGTKLCRCGCPQQSWDGPLTQPATAVPTQENLPDNDDMPSDEWIDQTIAEVCSDETGPASDYTTSPEDQALVDAMRAKQRANPVVDEVPIEAELVHELAETQYPQATEILTFKLYTSPILHLLESDGKIRTMGWLENEAPPEPGDHWAEPYWTDNGRRRYQQWFCWGRNTVDGGRAVIFMIPLEGVTLKPGEVA